MIETAAPWLYAGLLCALPFVLLRSFTGRLPELRELVLPQTGAQSGWTRAFLMGAVVWFVGAVRAGLYFAQEGDWVRAVLYPAGLAGLILLFGLVFILTGRGTDDMTRVLSGHMTRRRLQAVAVVGGVFYVGLLSFMAFSHDGDMRAVPVILAVAVAAAVVYFVRRLRT